MGKSKSHTKEKHLAKNVLIYGIGNIGAKLITFFLFPLYTHYLIPSDLGYFDVSFSIVALLTPLFTLQLREGVFRFVLDVNIEERKSIYKYVFQRIIKNIFILSVAAVIVGMFFKVPYLEYIVGLLVFYGIFEIQNFILRVESKKFFVAINILSVFLNLILFCFLVIFLDMGLLGLYLSNLLSRILSVLFIEIHFRFILSTVFDKAIIINKKVASTLLKYSVLMIPMGISGMLIDIIGKLFIEHKLGLDENGIYAVSTKFMAILLFLSYIFYQAWQETAIIEYKSPNRDAFFSKVFHSYLFVLSCLCSVVCLSLKVFYPYLIASDYQASLQYLYPLLVGVLFVGMISFLDLGYQCAKETKRSIMGVVYSIALNFILNYLLITAWGLHGATISFCLTYFFMFVYRMFSTRRYFKIKWDNLNILSVIILILSGILFYLIENIYILVSVALLLSILSLFVFMKKNKIKMSF